MPNFPLFFPGIRTPGTDFVRIPADIIQHLPAENAARQPETILFPPAAAYNVPMDGHQPTKAKAGKQLKGELAGDLAAYEQKGLYQRPINDLTAYRYRGALLRYQAFLGGNPPSSSALSSISILQKYKLSG